MSRASMVARARKEGNTHVMLYCHECKLRTYHGFTTEKEEVKMVDEHGDEYVIWEYLLICVRCGVHQPDHCNCKGCIE